jgi:hypothetical protein
MTTSVSPRLESSQVALRLGLCAAALAGIAAPVTDANAVVVTFSTPIPVPATFAGVYINLLTGANAPTTGAVPGWDFGPWGSTTLNFFWASASGAGGVGGTTYTDLPTGTVISGASTFLTSASAAAAAPFQATGTHTLGFKFFNESTAAINFGYLTLTSTGPLGHPAVVTGWSFENSGGEITVAAVPEASTTAMLSLGALALGAMNLRKLRRQRKLAS